jgi:hypothetical protein
MISLNTIPSFLPLSAKRLAHRDRLDVKSHEKVKVVQTFSSRVTQSDQSNDCPKENHKKNENANASESSNDPNKDCKGLHDGSCKESRLKNRMTWHPAKSGR